MAIIILCLWCNAHTIVIERPTAWKRVWWVLGCLERGFCCNTQKTSAVTRLTVGVSNRLQMGRNLIDGLPVVYQDLLATLGPFRECLTPAHEKRQKGTPMQVGVSYWEMDNGENARMHETNTYANEMHMMTWYAMHDTQAMTRQQQRITARHLAHQSRGVTPLQG